MVNVTMFKSCTWRLMENAAKILSGIKYKIQGITTNQLKERFLLKWDRVKPNKGEMELFDVLVG